MASVPVWRETDRDHWALALELSASRAFFCPHMPGRARRTARRPGWMVAKPWRKARWSSLKTAEATGIELRKRELGRYGAPAHDGRLTKALPERIYIV